MRIDRQLFAIIGGGALALAFALALSASPAGASDAVAQAPAVPTPALDGRCAVSTPECGASQSVSAVFPQVVPALGAPAPPSAAQAAAGRSTVIYFFWGDGCPHCAKAKPFLEQLTRDHPQVEVRAYEVWYDQANQEKFKAMAAAYGFEPQAVPTTFLGERHWVGYTDEMGEEIKLEALRCLEAGCKDAGAGVIAPAAEAQPDPAASQAVSATDSLTLPLIGMVNLQHQSLAISTALIAFVDGFNPCSLWVLTMLLAITLHTGSRRKVLIIGLVFLSVTAAVYALFIAGLFTVFTFASFTGWIRVVVAVVALFFAAVNIKDYFWYKEGISLTIADSQKPGLFQRMRGLVDASQSFGGLLSATVVLAAGVSLVEFSCTAGFPMLWTNLLSSQQVGAATFIALLAVYLIIYQLDELGVFFVSVYTLRAARLEEKHGRILKLAGGMLMLALAVVMLVNPSLMNDLGNSLLIFGAALGATLLVLFVHRTVLPRFGIWIGSEANSKQARRDRRRRSRT
jgi:glutaredoxin